MLLITILNNIDGLKFEDAYPNKLILDMEDIPIKYIGLKDLISNKTVSGRIQDITDLKKIKKINKQ